MRILIVIVISFIFVLDGYAQQQLRPGNPAPDFSVETLNGESVNLSQYRGKVVLMTFWSTRCAICHNEIPSLNRMAGRYKDRDVVFLALTMENNTRIEPYLKKNPFHFNIVPNSFGVVLKYADMDATGRINMGFPSYFVIDKRGNIEHRADGWDKIASMEARISRLLAE